MAGRPVTPDKIIELLAELKQKTPEYPPELLEARKQSFLQQAISINLQGKGPGGESGASSGGGGSGSSGGSGVFGGMSAVQGILLQATIGVWIIAAMLTAAYIFRNQIVDLLQGNETVNIEVTEAPPAVAAPAITEPPPTELPPTESPSVFVDDDSEDLSEELLDGGVPTENTDEAVLKDENGKQLGLTPGAPDVSGEGDPKATNKDQQNPPGQDGNTVPPGLIDKPDKPDKNK